LDNRSEEEDVDTVPGVLITPAMRCAMLLLIVEGIAAVAANAAAVEGEGGNIGGRLDVLGDRRGTGDADIEVAAGEGPVLLIELESSLSRDAEPSCDKNIVSATGDDEEDNMASISFPFTACPEACDCDDGGGNGGRGRRPVEVGRAGIASAVTD
jgi:hypothetical protein